MEVHPRLTRLSLGLEATGEWFYVHRSDGRLVVGELRRDPATGKLGLAEYRPERLSRPARSSPTPTWTTATPAARPWYVAAKATGRQAWSETYVLFGAGARPTSRGSPARRRSTAPDGSLLGVLGASFDVVELSTYLRGLKVGERGLRLRRRVPRRRDPPGDRPQGPEDPDPAGPAPDGGPGPDRELVPTDELADRRVAAFLGEVPAGLDPSRLQGTTGGSASTTTASATSGPIPASRRRETPDWLICIVMPEGDVLGRVDQSNRATCGIGLGVLVVATWSASTSRPRSPGRWSGSPGRPRRSAGSSSRPARWPTRSSRRSTAWPIAVEETKASLRSFRKYVPADLIRTVLATGQEADARAASGGG